MSALDALAVRIRRGKGGRWGKANTNREYIASRPGKGIPLPRPYAYSTFRNRFAIGTVISHMMQR